MSQAVIDKRLAKACLFFSAAVVFLADLAIAVTCRIDGVWGQVHALEHLVFFDGLPVSLTSQIGLACHGAFSRVFRAETSIVQAWIDVAHSLILRYTFPGDAGALVRRSFFSRDTLELLEVFVFFRIHLSIAFDFFLFLVKSQFAFEIPIVLSPTFLIHLFGHMNS